MGFAKECSAAPPLGRCAAMDPYSEIKFDLTVELLG